MTTPMDRAAYQQHLTIAHLKLANGHVIAARKYLCAALGVAKANGWNRECGRVLYALKMIGRVPNED